MGGSSGSFLNYVIDPVGSITKLSPFSAIKNVLYDQPKQARKDAERLSAEQATQQAKMEADLLAKKKKTESERARITGLNLARTAGLFKMPFTRGGTILTGPLGLPGGATGAGKSLLGS